MHHNTKNYISQVVSAANGHWCETFEGLGITIPSRGKHGPCPACGGKDRFRFDDKQGRGTWFCNQCDQSSGDGLDLVCRVLSIDVKEATKKVASWLGIDADGIEPAKRKQIHHQQQARIAKQRQETEQKQQSVAARAQAILAGCEQGQSAYLERKGLGECSSTINRVRIDQAGIVFAPGSLVVPLTNASHQVVNIQFINANGDKRYLTGGKKSETFHHIEGGTRIAVVEGYATGLSVHQAIGATVYCAMDCGNLSAVAKIARQHHPDAVIVIAGDNDADTEGNPGKTKAELAGAEINASVVLPSRAGDWNDYQVEHGVAATKQAIMAAVSSQVVSINKQQRPSASQSEVVPGIELPEGFTMDSKALYVLSWVGRGKYAREEPVVIASPISVLAKTDDESGHGHGRLLEWRDSRGSKRQWAMPLKQLVSRGGDEVFSTLLDSGVQFIDLGKKNRLRDYFMACNPQRQITCVGRTGWYKQTYVLPHNSIGRNADSVILQSSGYAGNDFTEAGTLSDWQSQVAALAVGNSRLCFSVSMAFAAPMLPLVGMEGGGFHLKGESTDGKTTVMKAAASVYGAPAFSHTWRATGNAIEGIASRRNDALLCLDEIGELDGREAGQTAYMLANGQGKGRSKQDGELRERKQWRLMFLSTGELSLEDHAAGANKQTQAGMEVRTLQIPSNTGEHGAFEELHGMVDGRTFADTLKACTECQYGTAFRAYIEALVTDLSGYASQIKADVKRLANEFTPGNAGNQVGRAINRFALVAGAGELATQLGITGWPAGESTRAAQVCLEAWLLERGHLGNHEDVAILRQVRQFFTANQVSHFADWNDSTHRPQNMVGYRQCDSKTDCPDSTLFYVLSEGWRTIISGKDPKKATKLVRERGWLAEVSKDGGRSQVSKRLPGYSKPVKVYVLNSSVIADEETDFVSR
ncbi:MAG: DUF927 domain-containing protein [Oceanisphaera sp.]|uniref:DUF927 domain-containing protein n=1 Tax=Oceanisphaera sp. TaxID=1929979 RepID=UPI003C793E6E